MGISSFINNDPDINSTLHTDSMQKHKKGQKNKYAGKIRLFGQDIVVMYRGKKRYTVATPQELGISGVQNHLSTDDIVQNVHHKLKKYEYVGNASVKATHKTASYNTLELVRSMKHEDMCSICNYFLQLPYLTQNSLAAVTIILFSLGGKALHKLHKVFPDLNLICTVSPANPKAVDTLKALIKCFSFNESYYGDNFQAYRPNVVTPMKNKIGWSTSVSTNLADYSYVYVKLKKGSARIFMPYRNASVVLESEFPVSFIHCFIEQNPDACIFLNAYSGKKAPCCPATVSGEELATVDPTVLKVIQDDPKWLAAFLDSFTLHFNSNNDFLDKLKSVVDAQLQIKQDSHYVSYSSDAIQRLWVILLSLYQQLLEWASDKQYCSRETAENNWHIVHNTVLDSLGNSQETNAGKVPLQEKSKGKIQDLSVFLTFLCEWIRRNASNICLPNEETKPGSLVKLHDIDKKGRFMVLREEPLLQQYLWWGQTLGCDMTFLNEHKPAERNNRLLEELQKQDSLFHCNCAPRCKLKFFKGKNEYVICVKANRLLEHANDHKIELESVLAGLMSQG